MPASGEKAAQPQVNCEHVNHMEAMCRSQFCYCSILMTLGSQDKYGSMCTGEQEGTGAKESMAEQEQKGKVFHSLGQHGLSHHHRSRNRRMH